MFTAKVYTVMIGSLSGTMEEVFTAKEVVRKYNQTNAESSGKLFLPVEWSMNPVDLKKVDLVIGIVGNWLDKPDIIEDYVRTGKQVILFFNAFQDPKNTIQSEHEEVKSFQRGVAVSCRCVEYRGITEFVHLLDTQLYSL